MVIFNSYVKLPECRYESYEDFGRNSVMTSDLQILSEFSVMVSNGLELVDWFQEVQWLFLAFQWVGQIGYPNFEGVHHHPIFFALRWLYLGVYPISRPGHPNRNPNLLLDGVESHSNGWWVYLRRAARWGRRLRQAETWGNTAAAGWW